MALEPNSAASFINTSHPSSRIYISSLISKGSAKCVLPSLLGNGSENTFLGKEEFLGVVDSCAVGVVSKEISLLFLELLFKFIIH
jgi:hypothetical protein